MFQGLCLFKGLCLFRTLEYLEKLIPEQVRTLWSVYLAKKSEGSAQSEEVYFSLNIVWLVLIGEIEYWIYSGLNWMNKYLQWVIILYIVGGLCKNIQLCHSSNEIEKIIFFLGYSLNYADVDRLTRFRLSLLPRGICSMYDRGSRWFLDIKVSKYCKGYSLL